MEVSQSHRRVARRIWFRGIGTETSGYCVGPTLARSRLDSHRYSASPRPLLATVFCFVSRMGTSAGLTALLTSTADALLTSRLRDSASVVALFVKICASNEARETETYAKRLLMSSG